MTDHCGKDALKDSTQDIEDIAEEPHDDELDRESFGTAPLEVLEDLRREDNDWKLGLARRSRASQRSYENLPQQAMEIDLPVHNS